MFIVNLATAGLLALIAASALAQAPSMKIPAVVQADFGHGDRGAMPRSTSSDTAPHN